MMRLGQTSLSRGYDPKHNQRVEDLLKEMQKKHWNETWWGQLLIALVSGVAGGLIVAWLT